MILFHCNSAAQFVNMRYVFTTKDHHKEPQKISKKTHMGQEGAPTNTKSTITWINVFWFKGICGLRQRWSLNRSFRCSDVRVCKYIKISNGTNWDCSNLISLCVIWHQALIAGADKLARLVSRQALCYLTPHLSERKNKVMTNNILDKRQETS